jgi:ADP-heptose:LPS heptosyltransferase
MTMKFESLVRIDDLLGEAACRAWNGFFPSKKGPPPEGPGRILVSKLRGVGDVVLALPLLKHLSDSGARVIFLGGEENYRLVRGLAYVDRVYHVNLYTIWRSTRLFTLIGALRAERITAAIDLTQSSHLAVLVSRLAGIGVRVGFENRNARKKAKNGMYTHLVPFHDRRHVGECYFDLLAGLGPAVTAPGRLEPLPLSAVDRDRAERFLSVRRASRGRLAGVHLSGPLPAKRWPLDRWAGVLDHLVHAGYTVVAVGLAGESPTIETARSLMTADASRVLNAAGVFDLPGLAALLARFDFFIANDGGPMHMSAAMGVPTIALFGAEHPTRYAPRNAHSTHLYKAGGLACSPCARPYQGSWPTCRDPACLRMIETGDVLDLLADYERTYGGRSSRPAPLLPAEPAHV